MRRRWCATSAVIVARAESEPYPAECRKPRRCASASSVARAARSAPRSARASSGSSSRSIRTGERSHGGAADAQQRRSDARRPGTVPTRRRSTRIALTLLVSASIQGCAGDAPVPAAYRAKVDGARASLEGNWDGLPVPIFRFASITCRADGGILVVFEERGGRHSGAFAFAMQGPGAGDGPGAWAGGYGVTDLATEVEIRFFFDESPEAPCPPRPGTATV